MNDLNVININDSSNDDNTMLSEYHNLNEESRGFSGGILSTNK